MPFSASTAAEELHGVVYLLEGGTPGFAVLAINRLDTTAGCVKAARWRKAHRHRVRRVATWRAGTQPANLMSYATGTRSTRRTRVMPCCVDNYILRSAADALAAGGPPFQVPGRYGGQCTTTR